MHPEVPAEHAITGVEGARAYIDRAAPKPTAPLLTETLGFTETEPTASTASTATTAQVPLGL